MIALHSAMSPVTEAGSSGTTSVATASLIQLLPFVISVMASLLATALVMRDRPQAVANAKFLIVAKDNKTTICDKDLRMHFRRKKRIYKEHVGRIPCSLCETSCRFKRVLRLQSSSGKHDSEFRSPTVATVLLKHSHLAGVSRYEHNICETPPNESSLRGNDRHASRTRSYNSAH